MGRPDQLIKRIFREETAAATGHRVRFEVPSEIPTSSLTPDGRLTRVVAPAQVATLEPPWCHLQVEALADFKMPGDHCDRPGLARAELRRWAQWVARLEASPDAGAGLDPRDFGTWFIVPHKPAWLDADVKRGVLTVTAAGPGCWRLGPRDHDVLWIAANDLPLRPELLPFLVARSGRPLIEFLLWAEMLKGPDWLTGVLQDLPMATELYETLHIPTDPEEQRLIHNEVLRRWLRLAPEGGDEIRREGVQEGRLQSLRHLFERRLGRRLEAAEQVALRERLATVGADRLDDVVLDLDAAALAAWLADPAAR